MEKTHFINTYKTGQRVDDYLIIRKVDLKTTNASGKKYLDFILGDATGDIVAKLWEVPENIENVFSPNMVVKVRGTVTMYQNSPQFKIELIREAQDDEVDSESLVVSAPLSSDSMYDEIYSNYILTLKNKDIKAIVSQIFNENMEELKYYPAAKRNHHSVRGGLLYHVLTMLRLGEKISEIYKNLNKDLLFAGIILHDMMKIKEMSSSKLGIVDEYTVEGTLLGHITQGVKNISRVAKEVGADPEIEMLLEHMVLSHHYEPEFGSPVRPMFKEAEILHYIDIIDARMYDFTNIENRLDKGTFSDFIMTLDRRRVYKPNFNED